MNSDNQLRETSAHPLNCIVNMEVCLLPLTGTPVRHKCIQLLAVGLQTKPTSCLMTTMGPLFQRYCCVLYALMVGGSSLGQPTQCRYLRQQAGTSSHHHRQPLASFSAVCN
jgi:hypothetical protein